MPTYNTRKARRIIAHLKRYGMDGIAAKALAKCGAFNPREYARPNTWPEAKAAKRRRKLNAWGIEAEARAIADIHSPMQWVRLAAVDMITIA